MTGPVIGPYFDSGLLRLKACPVNSQTGDSQECEGVVDHLLWQNVESQHRK